MSEVWALCARYSLSVNLLIGEQPVQPFWSENAGVASNGRVGHVGVFANPGKDFITDAINVFEIATAYFVKFFGGDLLVKMD